MLWMNISVLFFFFFWEEGRSSSFPWHFQSFHPSTTSFCSQFGHNKYSKLLICSIDKRLPVSKCKTSFRRWLLVTRLLHVHPSTLISICQWISWMLVATRLSQYISPILVTPNLLSEVKFPECCLIITNLSEANCLSEAPNCLPEALNCFSCVWTFVLHL